MISKLINYLVHRVYFGMWLAISLVIALTYYSVLINNYRAYHWIWANIAQT